MLRLNLFIVFVSVVLSGCASNQKEIIKYRELVQKKDYKAAFQIMNSDSIYNDEQSRLLKYLELGTLHLKNGEFYQSLLQFDKARELSDKLFTVSISKKVAGTIGNESVDNYYGEKYERSLIRYYTILAHYNLYDKGQYEAYTEDIRNPEGKVIGVKTIEAVDLDESKKRFHLSAAKSILLEWNSILEDLKKTYAGEVTYKDDLLAKFVGAVLHEKADTTTDRQIALNLYKESHNTVFRYYNSYQSFNLKYNDFNKEFKSLPSLKTEVIQEKFITPTPLSVSATQYADEKIKNWGKKERDNVYLVWHEGLIASKEIQKIEFPIGLAGATVMVGSKLDFISFSRQALMISVNQVVPTIQFEMAQIPYRPITEEINFIIKKNGIEVAQKPGVLVDPLSEMAFYTLDSKATADKVVVGTRVAAKHLAALGAAFLTYNNMKKSVGDGLAMISGIAAYNLAARGIVETERADLRSWLSLPHQIRMNSFKLEAGDYELFSYYNGTKTETLVGKFTVKGEEKIDLKTFY